MDIQSLKPLAGAAHDDINGADHAGGNETDQAPAKLKPAHQLSNKAILNLISVLIF